MRRRPAFLLAGSLVAGPLAIAVTAPLAIWVAGPCFAVEAGPDVSTTWEGHLTTPKGELALFLRIRRGPLGELSGELAIPQQNLRGLVLAGVRREGGEISFKVPAVQGSYSGKVDAAIIEGRWSDLY